MLSDEQIIQIKKQLIQQIESTFPEDKKESAIQQIESMNAEQLEEFLKQNNLMKNSGEAQQCVFCSIVSGKIPSHQLGENQDAIAVLEINPVSSGHTIIIPREHISSSEQMPQEAVQLAKDIGTIIKSKLNPKDVLVKYSNAFGHEIINIIPVYENENLDSQRKKASPEELEELQNQLTQKQEVQEEEQEKKPEEINEENTWLPERIP